MSIEKNNGKLYYITGLYLFVFTLSIYVLSMSDPFFLSFVDEFIQRYEVTKSIVERHELSIPEQVGIKGADGRYYSLFGLGIAVISAFFYQIGKSIGSYEINALAYVNLTVGAITVLVIYFFSVVLGYSKRSSLVMAVLYGFCTMAWPLAKHPFDHVMETLFVLLSVFFMFLWVSRRKIAHIVLSAVFLGIALNTRLTTLLVLPGLLAMLFVESFVDHGWKKALVFSLRSSIIYFVALLPFAVIVFWYNWYRFGNPLETGYQLVAEKSGLDFFTGTPLLSGLAGFLISPGKGFFYYSPVAIFFFFTIGRFYKRHRGPAICFLIIIVSYLVFLSKNVYWHGDWAWGPRYLLALTPYFTIPITEMLDPKKERNGNRVKSAFVGGIVALSVLIQLAAVSVHFHKYFYRLQVDHRIQFSSVRVRGIPTIFEPPAEVYFDWKMSPILAQFKYIYVMGKQLANGQPSGEVADDGMEQEKISQLPTMNVFDFWWAHGYFVRNSSTGLIMIPILLSVAAFSMYRAMKFAEIS